MNTMSAVKIMSVSGGYLQVPQEVYTISYGTNMMSNTTSVHIGSESLSRAMDKLLENPIFCEVVRDHLNNAIIHHNLSMESKKKALIGDDEHFDFAKFLRICPSDIGWGWDFDIHDVQGYLNICLHCWVNPSDLDEGTPVEGEYKCR
jgi:hypothetical protein